MSLQKRKGDWRGPGWSTEAIHICDPCQHYFTSMFTPCPLPLFLSPFFRPSPYGECSGPAGVCSSNSIQGVSVATHLSHALQAPRTRHGRGSLLQVRSLSRPLPVGHVAYSIKKLRLTFRDLFCRLVFELAPTPPPPPPST